MGSWSYVSGGKGFVCDGSISRSKNGLMSWELSSPFSSFGGFMELGSQDLVRNSSLSESLTSNRDFTHHNNAYSREEESSSKLSSSVVESNSRDSSSLIDLKLGGFPDHNVNHNKSSNNLSSAQSSAPAKRLRGGGLNCQIPYCQVHGCKKDLSSCKDYHKRHKVCEAHSKTSKVIVNGIEQRFCQQCSRFHLLAEFDDGKRSCRKRLAGHNERRRKPHTGMNSARTGRLFQSYTGTRFHGTAFSMSSFVCQDILPGNIMQPHKFVANDWFRNVKVEEGTDFCPQLAIPLTNGQPQPQPQPKPLFASYNSKKYCPPHEGGIGISDLTRGGISESSNSYLHDMAGPAYRGTSLGSEVLNGFDMSSTIQQGISGISSSDRALSLLSSHSQNHSLINPGTNNHYGINSSTSTLSVNPSGINSSEDAARLQQMMLFSNGGRSYAIDPVVQGLDYMNIKNQISGEDGPTIGLLQLSSQLQRVEHERRHSVQVKQESDTFSGLRIT